MKTIITQEIDGYSIITALSNAGGFIDPVETRKAIEGKIKETDTWKRIEKIHNTMRNLAAQGEKFKQEAKELIKLNKKNESMQSRQRFLDSWKEMKSFEPELKSLFVDLKKEYGKLMEKDAIYFNPKPGEKFVEDETAEQIKTLFAETGPTDEAVSEDLKKIPDNRGKIYWKKSGATWEKSQIFQLGKTPGTGEIEERKLTVEQRQEISAQLETGRIAAMSKAKKAEEREAGEARLRTQAAQMKLELEVSGDKAALDKAQKWLAAEIAKLDEIYK